MLHFDSIINDIQNLLDSRDGLSKLEIYEQLNINGLTKIELKILLKFQLNKKWKLSEGKYFRLSDQSEKDLYTSYREFIENNEKEKAYEILIKLNIYFPEKQEYLIERALMAKELNKQEQSELWVQAMDRLNTTAGKNHNVIHAHFSSNSPGKKFYFIRLGLFRKTPFVVSITDPETYRILDFHIIPDVLPPENLLFEHKVTVEMLVSAQSEKDAMNDIIKKVDNSSLIFETRYEKEIFIEWLIRNNISLPGLIISLEDIFDLFGHSYVSMFAPSDALENYIKIANLYFNDPEFSWMKNYEDDYVELNFINRYSPNLNVTPLINNAESVIKKYTVPNDISAVLGIGGILTKSGYIFRETQLRLSDDVYKNMKKAGVLIADAPAGIGKSFAYLAASLLKINNGEKIIISTFTKSLQNQIITRDIPSFFNKFELPIKTVQLQGISNYICLEKVKLNKGYQFLLNWINQNGKSLISEIPNTILESADRQNLSVNHSECAEENCPSINKCLYYKAVKQINSADIVVTNHFSLFNALSNVENKVHLIMDEGHHVIEAIMDAFSFVFSSNEIVNQLERFESIISDSLRKKITTAVKVIANNLDTLFQQSFDGENYTIEILDPEEILSPVLSLETDLRDLFERLEELNESDELVELLLCFLKHRNYHFFVIRDSLDSIYIKAVRKRFIHTFNDRLKESTASITMLSASMILKGWEDRHAKLLGFDKPDLKSYPAPFDYRRHSTVLLPSDIYSSNDRKESIVERSEIIVKLAQKLNGRTLVLFNSRLRMESYKSTIQPMLEEIGLTLLPANDEDTITHINDFRKAGSGHVLFGLRTLWEGIDIPGNALQCVVIESLPFKHPSDPHIAVEAKLSSSEDTFETALLPDAASTFLQGCGRLLRTENDKGIIVVLDKRIQYKRYAEQILAVLPEYPIIRDSIKNIYKQVDRFFQNDNQTLYDETDFEEWTLNGVKLKPEDYYNARSKILSFAQQRFRINRLKTWQENVIEKVFTGEDIVCIKETGAGKSLCYQLPALMRDALSVVVTPINSLMRDQVMSLRELGFANVGYLAADQDEFERQDTEYRLKKGEIRLLYVSPERLTRERFKELIKLNILGSLIIDEAHCISQWGHSFRLDFLSIGQFYKDNYFVNCAAFTATAPTHVLNDISMKLSLPNPTIINRLDARENLQFSVLDFSMMNRFELFGEKTSVLLQILNDITGAVIVYTSTKNDAERLSKVLNDKGILSAFYHAGMESESKNLVHERFRESGLKVVVATVAFGMGIDKSDVRAVIHFDIPGSPEAYYQEAGRAGRDGQNAQCVLMYHPDNERTQRHFINEIVYPREQVEDLVKKIREDGYRFFVHDKLNEIQEKEVMVLNYLTINKSLLKIQDVPKTITLKNRMLMAALYPEYFQDNMWLKENVNLDFSVFRKYVDDPNVLKKLIREWLGKSLIEASSWGNWYEPIKEITLSAIVDSFPFKELEEIQARSRDSFNKVLEYVNNKSECRYLGLSKYLGAKNTRSCGQCDICKSAAFPILEKQRSKHYSKKQVKREIISLIERLSGRSAKSYLINALVGEARNHIRPEHRSDVSFGALSMYTYQEVNSVMTELIEEGILSSGDQYLSLTTLGRNLLSDHT